MGVAYAIELSAIILPGVQLGRAELGVDLCALRIFRGNLRREALEASLRQKAAGVKGDVVRPLLPNERPPSRHGEHRGLPILLGELAPGD